MGLFDIKKRTTIYDDVDTAQLSKEIKEKNRIVEQLKNDIEFSKKRNEQIEEEYATKIKELEEKQSFYNEQISQQKNAYNEQLRKLDERKEKYQTSFDNKVAELSTKLEQLKDTQTELYAQQNELAKKDFSAKKKSIEEKIASITDSLKKQKETYDKNVDELKRKYNDILAKRDEDLLVINTKKNEFIDSANLEIERLEKQKEDIDEYYKTQQKNLMEQQESVASITRVQQAKDIADKQRELDDVNAELKSLETFKNSLESDLRTSKTAHEREYNSLVAKFENEKAELLRDNNLLKHELDEKQRRFEDENARHNMEYEQQVAQLNELISMLDKKSSDEENKLIEKLKLADSDYARNYRIHLEELEEDYNRQARARQDELDNLSFELNKEEEKCNKGKQFLDRQLANANLSYKNAVEDKTIQINNTQEALNKLEDEHNELVRSLIVKIADLKKENEKNLKSKTDEYENALKDLKNEYASKKQGIDEKIVEIKNNISSIKNDIADRQKDLDDFVAAKDIEKKKLVSERDSYLERSKREKQDIEQKIADIKALMEQSSSAYNNSLEALNNKRALAQTASDNKIFEINNKYSAKTKALKDEYDLNIERLTRSHDEKIESLTDDYNRSTSNLKQALEDKQRQLTVYSEEINSKIETLRHDTNEKVSNLNQQNDDLLYQIEDIKQKMQDETFNYDNDVKKLQEEYIARLDELSKGQNEAIQRVLSEYDTKPNQQLNDIKAEYEMVQKEYSESLAAIASNKRKLIDSENELKSQISIQKEALDNELSSKNGELERIKNDYNLKQSQQAKEIARLQTELDAYKSKSEIEIQSLVDQNNREFDSYQNNLNFKYETLARTLKDKQDRSQRQFEEELRALENETNTKVANLNSLLAEIDASRTNHEKQNASIYEAALKDVNESKEILQELNDKRLAESKKHIEDLDKIKQANSAAIKEKQKEYDEAIRRTKEEYVEKSKQTFVSISDIKASIGAINAKIENANAEFDEYKNSSNETLAALTKEFDNFLAYAKDTKNDINTKIDNYRTLINNAKIEYDNTITGINLEQEEAKRKYNNDIEEIKRDHENRISSLQISHDNNVKEIKENTNDVIAKYETDYKNKVFEANARFEEKKKEYDEAKKNIKGILEDITNDYESRIRIVNEQKNNLTETIANLGVTIDSEKQKYQSTIKTVQNDFENRLAELAKQHNLNINKIIEDEYNTPNRELREVSDALSAVQRQYNADLAQIENDKKQLSDEIASTENHNLLQRKAIESQIDSLNSELERSKAEYDKAYTSFNKEEREKQRDFDEYKITLENSLKQIKDNALRDEETLKQQLNDDLTALARQLAEKENDQKIKYEDDFKRIDSELTSKKHNLDALIREIEVRKETLKSDYSDKYDRINKETNDIREYLKALQNEHVEELNRYKESIEQLNASNDQTIADKQAEYDKLIEQTKAEYSLKHQQINDSIAETKENTTALENRINDIKNDYAKFLEETKARRQSIVDAHTDYMDNAGKAINEVTTRINNLHGLLSERQKEHNAEILKINVKRENLQKEYDSTIAEIDSLYKNKAEEARAEYLQKAENAKSNHEEALKAIKSDYAVRVKAIEQSFDDKKEEYRVLKKNYRRDIANIEIEARNKVESLKKQENEIKSSVESLQAIMNSEKEKYDAEIKHLNDERDDNIDQITRIYQDNIDRIVLENETNPNKQLDEVKARYEAYQKEYDDRLLQISQDKKAIDEKEFEINKKNSEQKFVADNELAAKNEEYTRLKAESERLFGSLDVQLADKRNELAAFTKEINAMPQKYRHNKEQDFLALSSELDGKFNSLLDNNSIVEQTTSSEYNNKISNMKISYNAKIAEIDRKINEINEIKSKKQEESSKFLYEKNNELTQSIADLKELFEKLNGEQAKNVEYYKETIEKTTQDNHLAIEKKRKELAASLEEMKANLAIEADNIRAHTDTLRKQIEKISKNIEKANKEFDEYALASQNRNNAVLDEQSDYLGYIDKQKAKVDEKIDEIKTQIANKQARFDEQFGVIESQKAEIQSVYDNKILNIDKEYQDKIRALNEKNNANIAEARERHDNVLRSLQKSYEDRCARLNEEFEAKKEELKNIKANYKGDIEKYKQNIKERIDELKNQQKELSDKINEVRARIRTENADFIEESKRIQAEYDNEIKQIDEDNRNKIRELNHTYIDISNDELNMVKSTLSETKLEYENTVANYETKKKELDDYEKSIIDKFEQLRHETTDSYNKKRAQYDETYEKLQGIEYNLDDKLNQAKENLEALRVSVDEEIEKIKAGKAKELDDYTSKCEADYNNKQEQFKEIEDSIALKNDKEVEILANHLNSKKESIESLINEINNRKKKAEEEKNVEYNDAVAATNKLQSELDSVVNENSMKKTSYESELASKKETNRSAIESLKTRIENALAKRQEELVEINERKQKEIKELQEQISSLRVQKDEVNKKLSDYEKEKNAFVENLNNEMKTHISSIDEKLVELANKAVTLDETHKKRVKDIKTYIAQTVSEYDDLMKLKIKLISDAHEEEIDFMSVTKKFKDMIDELEKSHNKILVNLEEKRVSTIESIKKEIEDIDTTKPERLKQFEEEIVKLTDAYDAMLVDEREKQDVLSNELLIANREREKLEESTIASRNDIEKDYESIKQELNNSFTKRLEDSNSQFERLSTSLRKEFNDLVNTRNALNDDLSSLNDGFMKVDDNIRKEMMQLKNSYNTQLLTIQAEYDAKVKTNRERLKSIDTMSNNTNELLF